MCVLRYLAYLNWRLGSFYISAAKRRASEVEGLVSDSPRDRKRARDESEPPDEVDSPGTFLLLIMKTTPNPQWYRNTFSTGWAEVTKRSASKHCTVVNVIV